MASLNIQILLFLGLLVPRVLMGADGQATRCDPQMRLTYDQLRSMDPEEAYRLRIGMSEADVLALGARKDTQVDKLGGSVNDPARYWEYEYSIRRDGAQSQFVYIKDKRVVAIAQYAEDDEGSPIATTSTEALGMLADSRAYLCWRFGAWVEEIDPDQMWLSTIMVGPRRILGEAHGSDSEIAFDVWVAKEFASEDHFVMYLVRERQLAELPAP